MDYSDDRGEIYEIRSNKKVEYKMICSFEGKYDHMKFFKDLMGGILEDDNIITLMGLTD
jgi:hypothetical protein